jgi:hypothetical protein
MELVILQGTKLLKNAFTGCPEVRGNQSIYLIRQNTVKANAFLIMMMMMIMAEAMILLIYRHNTQLLRHLCHKVKAG